MRVPVRRFEKIAPGGLITPEQAAVVRSCFPLAQSSQMAWARDNGVDPTALSRMLNGIWVVPERVAQALNVLVLQYHPVEILIAA
jgi:hypothetical protein